MLILSDFDNYSDAFLMLFLFGSWVDIGADFLLVLVNRMKAGVGLISALASLACCQGSRVKMNS